MRKIVEICFWLCLICVAVCFLERSYAEEDKGAKVVIKEITGEVSFVDEDFISIVYKKEGDSSKEYEMILYIDKEIVLDNMREEDFKKLDEQDIVNIEYMEINKEGRSKRVAKRIRFVGEKALSLNLKGFKK